MTRRRPRRHISAALGVSTLIASPSILVNATDLRNETLTIASPTTTLPWVVLTPDISTFQDPVDTNNHCLGLLISPSAALMAASCVQRYHHSTDTQSLSVAVSIDATTEVNVGDVVVGGFNWRQRNVKSVTLHPEYELNPIASYDVAVVQWRELIGPSTRMSVLLDPTDSLSSEFQVATIDYEVGVSTSRSLECNGGVQCTEITWNSSMSCPELTGFVEREVNNRIAVSGLISNLKKIDSVSTSSRLHAAVSSLGSVRGFIDTTSSGHRWLDPPVIWDETPVPTVSPDLVDEGSNNTDKQNASSTGDTDIVDIIQLPAQMPWRPSLMSRYGYLSQHRDLPDDTLPADDGGIAVIIAPLFVLTRANWIHNMHTIQWVHFASQTIRIKRVVADPTDQQPDKRMVFELESTIDDAYVEIPTTLPPKYKDLDMLTTYAYNERAFANDSTDHMMFIATSYNALDDRSLCGIPELGHDDDLICVQSSGLAALSLQPNVPVNVSFLFVNDFLVGVGRGASVTGGDHRVAQPFEPLGAPHVRSFLNDATNGTIVWTKEDVYATGSNPVIFGQPLLYANKSTLSTSLIQCGVVPLSMRFYLTTASCLDGQEPTWLVIKTSEDEESPLSEELDMNDESLPRWLPRDAFAIESTIIHPAFHQSPSPAYDFAIIKLVEHAFPSGFVPVRLMGDTLTIHAHVMEQTFGCSESEYEPSRVVETSQCGSPETKRIVCVSQSDSSAWCNSSEPRSSRPHGLFYRVGPDVGFVGFTIAHEPCDRPRPYSQVANIINFINAVVDTPQWGVVNTAMNKVDVVNPPAFSPLLPTPAVIKPYVVGLRLTKTGQNFCGGTLIAPQFVLTAAHCVSDGLAAWAAIGSLESSGLGDAEPIPIDTTRTRIHPQYQSPYEFSHDAAIIELAVPAYAAPISLDLTPDFADGTAATMYGYGVESATSNVLSPVMHARDLTLLSQAKCAKTLPNTDDSVMCALAPSGFDACTGDSGSPLVVHDEASGTEQLVGIVSAGYGCGVPGVPGLYTRVANLVAFVNAYTIDSAWSTDPSPAKDTSEATPKPVTPTNVPGSLRSPTNSPRSPPLPIGTEQGNDPTTSAPGVGNQGSSNPSTGTDVPRVALEDRNGIPDSEETTSRPASVLTPADPMASSTFQASILKTPLPQDTFSAFTTSKLLSFLIGDYPYSFVPSTLLNALASPTNNITFFTSGDVRPLLQVLVVHDTKPLNQRRDRFGRLERLQTNDSASSYCTATAH